MARIASLLTVVLLVLPLPAAAQDVAPLSGTVIDAAGAPVSAARVLLTDGAGRLVRATRTDTSGEFSLYGIAAGDYQLEIAMADFLPAQVAVRIPSDAARSIRVTLHPGGFAERVVVTARRGDGRAAETPQKVETIDARDLERTVAADLTDVLKKSAGVDVIQYSGVLSGIGIRGFRPQFSGINKRSLLLVDGRPSGITNLATIGLDDVERVEVLKGAASSIYGSSAMGGVVNVITRQSRGPLAGAGRVGFGSFGTTDLAGRIGGNVASRVDFDLGGSAIDQRHDFRMGDGLTRPATSFSQYEGAVRVGVDLSRAWRVSARLQGYRGRDIMTPGDLASGIDSQGSKDLEHSSQEGRVTANAGRHQLSLTGYHAREAGHTTNVTSFDPADAPFLPYLAFESALAWAGAQARDTVRLSPMSQLVAGVDYERVDSVGRNFAPTGARVAPFSADSRRRTIGIYAQHTLRLRGGATTVDAGGRIDRLAVATLDTPLKTNFVPSEAVFHVFNPSAGLSQALGRGTRIHATVGRAFVPADASQLTGFTTSTFGGRTQITQGNPALKPEHSVSFDAGFEWTAGTSRIDVTTFATRVKDRFVSNVVISNPPPPAPVIVSVVNGLDAHLSGLEIEAEHQWPAGVRVFANTTHYFSRRERLASGAEQNALNVPLHSLRFGTDVDRGPIAARILVRHVRGAMDNDFNLPGFPIVDRANFTVTDLSATWRIAGPHAVGVEVNNLFDAYYYETLGYPLPGASFRLSYRVGF